MELPTGCTLATTKLFVDCVWFAVAALVLVTGVAAASLVLDCISNRLRTDQMLHLQTWASHGCKDCDLNLANNLESFNF